MITKQNARSERALGKKGAGPEVEDPTRSGCCRFQQPLHSHACLPGGFYGTGSGTASGFLLDGYLMEPLSMSPVRWLVSEKHMKNNNLQFSNLLDGYLMGAAV